jgi:hypothetical protein
MCWRQAHAKFSTHLSGSAAAATAERERDTSSQQLPPDFIGGPKASHAGKESSGPPPSHFPPSLWTKQSRQGSCRALTKFAMSIPSPPDSSHSWNHNLPISIPNQSQGTAELHSDGNHRSRVRRLFELHGWLGGTREGGA